MAAAKITCRDCHEVKADYPGAIEHEKTYVLGSPTPAMCQKCHEAEVAQFNASRHSLPAYVAVFGSKDLSPEQMAAFKAVPEGSFAPYKARNAIGAVEAVNAIVKQSDKVMKPLVDQKLLTPTQFDEPIEYTYFELWHHWGRTAKFGTWMQGPDYTQWHGAYEMYKALTDLREMASRILEAAGK